MAPEPALPGRKRVLLICPEFFNYPALMASAIERLGFEVTIWGDRAWSSTRYKLFLRKFPQWAAGKADQFFLKKINGLTFDSHDHVIIVKGEGLSVRVVTALRQQLPKARFSLYIWDAVRNTPNSGAIAKLADAVSTFDPDDAETEGWRFRPLFAEPNPPLPDQVFDHDWSFIGTIHSDRGQVIQRFRKTLGDKRNAFVFGYFPSKLIYLMHWLRFAEVRAAPHGQWSLAPMKGADAANIIGSSRAVLDVEHPRQSGMTIRTIETLLAGRKLITTNSRIRQSALFDPSRAAVIDRNNPSIDAAFFDTPFKPVEPDVIYAYSIECWARDVLGLPHPQPPAAF